MKVMVVGGGGREHALVWKIARSEGVEEVLCVPGNGGTQAIARNVDLAPTDIDGIVALATREAVDLVVVGPEDPLCMGLCDRLRDAGVRAFGPGASGARLEGSKVFTKEFLERHRIPTGAWRRFDRSGAAKSYVETLTTWPQVVKADGLAGGKGVFVCDDAKEACAVIDSLMEERRLGDAGQEVVIEDFLVGRELSVHAITDGNTLLILEPVMDYKQVGEGDTGPNTGGMGIHSPVSFVTQRLMRQIEQRVLIPTVHALKVEGMPYAGTLFAGLMITDAGPQVLEYNCRFGDPETQAIMRRLRSDIVPYLMAASEGKLDTLEPPEWDERACVGVVACADGYPGSYTKGDVITGVRAAEEVADTVVFHAGTRIDGNQLLTNGGRVLCVTSLATGLETAREQAYQGADAVRWSGKFVRPDIGLPRATRATESDAVENEPTVSAQD